MNEFFNNFLKTDYISESAYNNISNNYAIVDEAEEIFKKINLEHPNVEVLNITPEQLTFWIKTFYEGSRDALFIWGAPGLGKTQSVESAAKDLNVAYITTTLSTKEAVDFIGLPSIESGRTIFNPPYWFPVKGQTYHSDEKDAPTYGPGGTTRDVGILFFDEMNRADRRVLSASLQLILDKKLDDVEIPEGWYIVAAGNRPEDDIMIDDTIGTALSSRFLHVNLVNSFEEWEKWILDKSKKIKTNFPDKLKVHPLILEFLRKNKEYFHHLYKYEDDRTPIVWANPRNWVRLSQNLYNLEDKSVKSNMSELQILPLVKQLSMMHVGKTITDLLLKFFNDKEAYIKYFEKEYTKNKK